MLNKDARHDQKELKDNKDQTEVFVVHPKSFIFFKKYPSCYGHVWQTCVVTTKCCIFSVVMSVWRDLVQFEKILWVNSPYLLLSWFKFLRIDLEIIVKCYQSTFFGFEFFSIFSTFVKVSKRFDFQTFLSIDFAIESK